MKESNMVYKEVDFSVTDNDNYDDSVWLEIEYLKKKEYS
jgi:hypothetical protein